MNIRPVAAKFFHTESRTGGRTEDVTKLIIVFSSFANRPNKKSELKTVMFLCVMSS
jgi:hypothetical protein